MSRSRPSSRPRGPGAGWRGRDTLSAVTAVVLVLLALVSAWAVTALSASTADVQRTTARVRAYQSLEQAVSAQAFAEAAVRRSPSEVSRLRLETAIADVERSVTDLRPVVPAGDGAMLSYLVLLNERYVLDTRRSVQDVPQVSPNDRVAGPALDAVQDLVGASIASNRADVDAAVQRQVRLVSTLSLAVPAVVLIAAAALLAAVRSSRSQTRRLASSAAAAETRATTDSLTGLLNRAGFDAAAGRLLPTGRTCLLLIDLDRFKTVNDTHGHAVGDQVLVAVAHRMRGVLRPSDVLARLGGDEFAALLPGGGDATRVAERLCEVVAQPLEADGIILIPSVSVGTACSDAVPDRGEDLEHELEALLKAADTALYRAKADGRNRVRGSTRRSRPTVHPG